MTQSKSGKELDTHELAWAAGFFDGEGHTRFDFINNGRILKFEISQVQSNAFVLKRFQTAVGGIGGISEKKVYGKSSPQYRYTIGDFEHVQYVVVILWRFLSPQKKYQARDALVSYLASKSNIYSKYVDTGTPKDHWRRQSQRRRESKCPDCNSFWNQVICIGCGHLGN